MNTSYILYEGPSRIDGAPIVIIATGFGTKSKNEKTGNMIQTWILRQDVSPVEAVKSGQDVSICGDCKHRGTSCYVTVFQAPQNVWRAYKAGKYKRAIPLQFNALFKDRKVRFGAYGDPAAAPLHIWKAIASHAAGYTGYTHQWKDKRNAGYAKYCMASVDAVAERNAAIDRGFRTFRVKSSADLLTPNETREVICPASDEAGNKLNCETCMSCNGTNTNRLGSIVITVHGSKAKVNQFNKMAA